MKASLQISNYKSIGSCTIVLEPGIRVLVGPNGSGKTCLLSALNFLRDALRSGAALAVALQGGPRRAYRHGEERMSFLISSELKPRTCRRSKVPCTLTWQLTIAQAGAESIATIVDETVVIQTEPSGEPQTTLFRLALVRPSSSKAKLNISLATPEVFGRDLFSSWTEEHAKSRKTELAQRFPEILKRSLSGVLDAPDRSFFEALSRVDAEISSVHELFSHLNEFNISPATARASTEQLPFARMMPNGSAVAEVIDALENGRYHKLDNAPFGEDSWLAGERFQNYYHYVNWRRRRGGRSSHHSALEAINKELAAAVRPISHVSVQIDPTNGRRFVVFKSTSDTFSPEEVSDGTVKWLCILVSLFVPYSRVYLLEEPENFLHPWMQQRLIELMRERARQENTVFLLSSHSATVLNSLVPGEILVVRQGESGTTAESLEDVGAVTAVLEASNFHLGDLWISGAIGGVPLDE